MAASTTPRLAIVVSEDSTVDVIPVLRLRARRSTIEEQIAKLEVATADNYRPVIAWLDDHRFYLDQSQCDRVNAAQNRLENLPGDVGELRILRAEFPPDPQCTAEFFEPEGDEGAPTST